MAIDTIRIRLLRGTLAWHTIKVTTSMTNNLRFFAAICLIALLAIARPAQTAVAQNPPAIDNLYHIALNGTAVTVDGDLSDWDDAHWTFLSVDHPAYGILDYLGDTGTIPSNPNDASGWFALKMDGDNLYVGVRVRDEDGAMLAGDGAADALRAFDHVNLWIGLYDMGADLYGSPHSQVLSEGAGFSLTDPTNSAAVYTGSSHRIAPGTDNTGTTLGADYALGVRAREYADAGSPDAYAFGNVGQPLAGSSAAVVKFSDGKGYSLEWAIPFASLAGKIADPAGALANFEWPSFTPAGGMIVPFDLSIGDVDEAGGDLASLRVGTEGDPDTDAASFGARGMIVDMASAPNNTPRWTYLIDYKPEQNVTLDGDLSDWSDAAFRGLSQDHPLFTVIQGTPRSPDDFSGYIGLKMDDENVYAAVRVRDEGTAMIETFDTPNLAFNYDHLSLYLGLYDIADVPSNPHVEGPGEFEIYRERFAGTDSARTDTIVANRTYRIGPGTDNTSTTRGADYQLLLRSVPYGPEPVEPQTYSGAYVDTTMYEGTEAAALFTEDEGGYIIEWKIPFTTMSSVISKGSAPYRGIEWPLFEPADGTVISFDADLTDKDERDGARTQNRFLRLGDLPSLWRDSKSFRMRGLIVQTDGVTTSTEPVHHPGFELPSRVELRQNYPNPFNPSTRIEFALPQSGHVTLAVYDQMGRRVATLVDGTLSAGLNSVVFDAGMLSSGTYFYQIQAAGEVVTRQLTLVK